MSRKIEYIKDTQRDLLKLDAFNRRIILRSCRDYLVSRDKSKYRSYSDAIIAAILSIIATVERVF